MIRGTMRWMLKHEWIWIALLTAMYLRIPTLLEPYWYGDETMYLTIGQSLRDGAQLYKDIHDNKPPLIYFVAAAVDGNQFWYRIVAAGTNIGAVAVFAMLARKLFENKKLPAVMATWVFVILTNVPLWEGNIGNAENFFIFFTTASAYILFTSRIPLSTRRVVGAGLLLGVGGLFKIPPLLEVVVAPWVWFALKDRKWFVNSLIFGLCALLPLGLSIGYFAIQGVLHNYLIAAGLQNLGYVSVWGPTAGVFLLKNRALLLLIVLGILWALARNISRRSLVITTWLVVTLFAALLSGRPYPHYLLQLVPPLALAVAGLIYEKRAGRLVLGGVLGLVVGGVVAFRFWTYPVAEYYSNYLQWITNRHTRSQYIAWFNPAVSSNYSIAQTIQTFTSPDERIFVWSDDPTLYALAQRKPVGRFTVRYHVKDFKAEQETLTALRQNPPKLVITQGDEGELPGLVPFLESNYRLLDVVDSHTIYIQTAGQL